MHYFILVVCWVLYFTIHSLLASNKVKDIIYNRIPIFKKYYRIAFNFIAITTLIPIIYYTLHIQDYKIWNLETLTYIGYFFIVLGLLILGIAFASFNLKEFFGLEQYQESEQKSELVITGIYQYVRHPLYFGIIVLFIGLFFLMPTFKIILVNGISFIYLIIGSRLEEQKLIDYFGQSYIDYKSKVKGLIPFVI
ncbi:MAG: isoprenylcysteine carboxylmethyltransferase family protein [Chitinophagales bacterium]|nr:isoprenylcysteine carboxylmethyltransferase family protein [Chitinophagales bacterium]